MPEIGATLREARMRARIDVSEIEAQTKIRARYLRALENEEWDLLPGPTFIKSFLRTYASALGLDGKALVEEYRRSYELPDMEPAPPLASRRRAPQGRRPEGGDPGRPPRGAGGSRGPRSSGGSRGYTVTIGLVAVVILFLVIGLLTRGSPKSNPSNSTRTDATKHTHVASRRRRRPRHHATPPAGGKSTATQGALATLSLHATSTVWVCLVSEPEAGKAPQSSEAGTEAGSTEPGQEGAAGEAPAEGRTTSSGTATATGGEKLIPGIDLQEGETKGPYRGKRLEVTLGNSSVTMTVNGSPVTVPESTTPLGYEITSAGASPLTAEHQPTCG